MPKRRFLFFALFVLGPLKPCMPPTDWTVMIYIAGDNDLERFVKHNLKQMMKIGSNERVSIIVQVNTNIPRDHVKTSKILKIHKDSQELLLITDDLECTDSGDPQTLINFCRYAVERFPAKRYALILWDHGTGPIDPFISRRINTTELFHFSAEYDEDIAEQFPKFFGPLTFTNKKKGIYKGVCFDDTTGNFLCERKLAHALEVISTEILGGEKIDLLGFDACLMAMIEIASLVKPYAHVMVASQEVELGTGWDYRKVLNIFTQSNPTPETFGKHIVKSYARAYHFIDDFTLSCVDLSKISDLEKEIGKIAQIMQQGIASSEGKLLELLRICRYKHACIHFDEPDYVDMGSLLENLLHNVAYMNYATEQIGGTLIQSLIDHLVAGKEALEKTILANQTGMAFKKACGLSIYFPEHRIHRSYKKTAFAKQSRWLGLLQQYIA